MWEKKVISAIGLITDRKSWRKDLLMIYIFYVTISSKSGRLCEYNLSVFETVHLHTINSSR